MEWIILEKPIILTILIITILLNLFDKKAKASKGVITLLSALIYVAALTFLCVSGAGYQELIVLMLIFLLFNFDIIKERRSVE